MPVSPLGEREKEILQCAAEGLTNKEIATQLGIKIATVRTYWERIRRKLNAGNRAHAVALAMPHNRLERAGEELAAFVLRAIDDEVISICDAGGRFLTWNKGVKTLFGYTEHEWIGQHNSIIFVPEEKQESQREFDDADKAGASVNDRWHLRKDGTRFWGTNVVISLDHAQRQAAFAKLVRPKAPPAT